MPGFAEFNGLDLGKKLSKEELVRALRFMQSAEYEAVQLYGQIRDVCPDEKIKKAIQDVIEEEQVHAGEFQKMVHYVNPEEEKLNDEGMGEAEDNLKSAGRVSFADHIRFLAGKKGPYVWTKGDKDHPDIKTLKYVSPTTGKKFHVSPSGA